jgi:HTH-type transcriptional regulator, competence development regulator
MGTPLGDLLQKERNKRNLTLREVEQKTGIHNAHLSQIEKGSIARPAPNMLFTLAALYELPYEKLMQLAGHFTTGRSNRRSLQGAALHAMEELSPTEQRQVLEYMQQVVRERKGLVDE